MGNTFGSKRQLENTFSSIYPDEGDNATINEDVDRKCTAKESNYDIKSGITFRREHSSCVDDVLMPYAEVQLIQQILAAISMNNLQDAVKISEILKDTSSEY